jgi:cellulase/cellobiase CelA1
MSEPLRVFVNGTGVSVPPGSTVLDAVHAADSTAAEEIRAGTRAVVDSRGLPVANDAPLSGGFVMRVVSARAARSAASDGDAAE